MSSAPAQFRVPAEYESISAALAAAAPVGGTVILAPGVYREGATIKVPAGVSLVGSGAGECIIESDACTTLACADGVVLLAELCVQQARLTTLVAPPSLPACHHAVPKAPCCASRRERLSSPRRWAIA